MGVFLVSFVILVALVTVLSGIGVGEHCGVGSGGVYSMISSVLGGQTGGTVGLLYVFGQVSWAAGAGGLCPEATSGRSSSPAVLLATISPSMPSFALLRGKLGELPPFTDGQTRL